MLLPLREVSSEDVAAQRLVGCYQSSGSLLVQASVSLVFPFALFAVWVPLLKPNGGKKGTLIPKGLLGNQGLRLAVGASRSRQF